MKTVDTALRESAEELNRQIASLSPHPWKQPAAAHWSGLGVGLTAAVLVILVFAVPTLLRQQPAETLDSSDLTTLAPSTTVITEPRQDTPLGDPVSDSEIKQMFPLETGFVPGTGRHLATVEVPELGSFGIYTVQATHVDPDVPFDTPAICLLSTGGGSVCGQDVDPSAFRITMGSSCPPTQFALLGLEDEATVSLHFTDDTEVHLTPTNGTVVWAWNDNLIGLADITFSGVANSQGLHTEAISQLPPLPTQPCN